MIDIIKVITKKIAFVKRSPYYTDKMKENIIEVLQGVMEDIKSETQEKSMKGGKK